MNVVTALRRHALLRIAAILVVITTGIGWYLVASLVPAEAATSDDILFVHGISGHQSNGSTNTVPGGCTGTWGTAESYFRSHGWTGNFKTVGYYRGDWQNGNSCDVQFDSQAPNSNHQSNCDSYNFSTQTQGTNNQDLGNIACQLAWYIYNQYTVNRKNVHIVAHSMGGLITRWALDRVYYHDPAFPPFLYVPTVTTFATPHGGIPIQGAAWVECGGCTQASNMQLNAGAPSYFINTLLAETSAPMGSPGEPTQWTLIASTCESWTEGAPDSAALQFPNSASGYPVVHKIDYTVVPQDPGTPSLPLCAPSDQPDYLHGDYLTDQSDKLDALANTCDNCSFPGSNGATVYHSLHVAYQNTAITVPAPPAYPVINISSGGAFFDKWWQMGGVSGVLGDPTNAWYSVQNGHAQNFQSGGIYWAPALNTNAVHGAIYSEYTVVMKGPTGALGFPVTDEQGIAGGRVSYFAGASCAGGGPNGSGSAIFWTSGTGAHEVQGCIYHEYVGVMGGPGGALGFPLFDEQAIAGGHVSYFAGQVCNGGFVVSGKTTGSGIFDTPSTGAHEVQGCIYSDYVNVMGGPGGALGFPVTDEQGIAGGRVSYFAGAKCGGGGPNGSGSAIYYKGSVSPYGNSVQGCIYHEYVGVMGGPGGALGFPLWDEEGIAGGRVSYFVGQVCSGGFPVHNTTSGSAIYWTSGTGAHEVQGCIYHVYTSVMSGPGGALGFPTSDEHGVTSGFSGAAGRANTFQHGTIIWWANGRGTFEVQGSIYNSYLSFQTALGFPISNEYTIDSAGDRESDFENGFITWTKATGQVSVTVYPPCC
jgi:uncharacterized protein with LGFP repeats